MTMLKLRKIQVPVMRNGKPTKRMKEVYEPFFVKLKWIALNMKDIKFILKKKVDLQQRHIEKMELFSQENYSSMVDTEKNYIQKVYL